MQNKPTGSYKMHPLQTKKQGLELSPRPAMPLRLKIKSKVFNYLTSMLIFSVCLQPLKSPICLLFVFFLPFSFYCVPWPLTNCFADAYIFWDMPRPLCDFLACSAIYKEGYLKSTISFLAVDVMLFQCAPDCSNFFSLSES